MRILLISDMHLCYSRPVHRIDAYFNTQYGKVCQILDIYRKMGCELALQAGDFLDSPRPPDILKSVYIELFRKCGIQFYCVLGQHDVPMHSLTSVDRSAFNVLKAAGCLFLLGENPLVCNDIYVYGSSFGADIPEPKKGKRCVLVIHKMIGSEVLYPNQDIIHPDKFLKDNSGYELILCGDYHYTFLGKTDNSLIVNTGAMVRKTCSERDMVHKPCVAVYDTDSRELSWHDLEIAPAKDVFSVVDVDESTFDDGRIVGFIDKLRSEMGVGVSFSDNLYRYFEEYKTPEDVKNVILERLEKVGDK